MACCSLDLALQCSLLLSPSACRDTAQPSPLLLTAYFRHQNSEADSCFLLPLQKFLSGIPSVRGGQHRDGWGLTPLLEMGNNSAHGSQAAGVCMGMCVPHAPMAPSLALPGGNKHGLPRERQQKLSEKELIFLFPGLKSSTKSLSLEIARETRLVPSPQSILCT